MLVAVWRKQTCFIQFLLKNRASNFRDIFLSRPVVPNCKKYISERSFARLRDLYGLQ